MNHENIRLREFDRPPTSEMLMQVLGDSYQAYETFLHGLGKFEIEQNWQWYTPNKAWYAKGQFFWITTRGTRKEKNLYWLHVFDGYFNVAVWFLEKNRGKLLQNDFSDEIKQIIINAETYGKLATFPVTVEITCANHIEEVYKLICCKKNLEV